MKTGIFFTALAAAAYMCGGCDRPDNSSGKETEWIDPKTVKPGPSRRDSLTEEQMARITQLQKTFSEVDPSPVEKWVNDFKRDQNPEKELRVWESMAVAFEGFTRGRNLTLEQKKEAFGVALMRSGAPEEEVLPRLELKVLTKEDARMIMALFNTAPAPITVIQK